MLLWLAVDSGDIFALMVDNFTQGGNGFAIDFVGTTATLVNAQAVKVNYAFSAICEDFLHTEVYFNYPMDCASVSSDFSEFTMIDNTGASLSITAVHCDSAANRMIIECQKPSYPIDSVTLHYASGSDGDALKAFCGNSYLAPGHYGFGYLYNNMGLQGFVANNFDYRYSFTANVSNVPFVDWYVNGTFLVSLQASQAFNYNLSLNQNYRVCMVATLGCNKDSSCKDYIFTGIDEIAGESMQLYPNPSNGSVTVQASFPIQRIEIMDLQGRLILSEVVTFNSHVVSTALLPDGMYLVRVVGTKGSNTTKLVVDH